jgi:ABC-type Fe3+/spermidine/putrescine transport system ATPase subunit
MAPDEQAAAAIAVRGLDVIRGDTHVLHDVTLDVPRGRITGLLGPSGCGKSTLMRSIVGVQIIAGGEIDVLGLPAGSAALRPHVGYVTQAPSVYADLSVAENLRYFGALYGVVALALGGVFVWLSLRLWREAERRSALRTYLFSLAYLALLFCAMVLDARL